MKRLALAVVLLTAMACGGETSAEPGPSYDMTPPAAEPGAACQPSTRRCDGSNGVQRVCWFMCPQEAPTPASSCTPTDHCVLHQDLVEISDSRPLECLYWCPLAVN